MADAHFGPRPIPSAPHAWPVTKIFTAFRIALDIKKLALAAAGIFCTYLGWWAICAIFYTDVRPQWEEYENPAQPAAWRYFKRDRARWNLLHKLAGHPTDDPAKAVLIDAGDLANSREQYAELKAVLDGRRQVLTIDDTGGQLLLDGAAIGTFKAADADVQWIKKSGPVPLGEVVLISKEKVEKTADGKTEIVQPARQEVIIADRTLILDTGFDKLRQLHAGVKPLSALSPANRELFVAAFDVPLARRVKPAGLYRVCPWNEDRGENPFLLTSRVIHQKGFPSGRDFFSWLVHEQLPVLAEPLIKFFSPIWYLFDGASGGFRNRMFLICIILWNLAVWGFFGGAICRLAAVQFARNEKIPLSEAINFVVQRLKHFVLAPMFPLLCLAGITLLLALFGLLTGFTYWFGDVVFAGLLFPLLLIAGLVMAVLLIGLFAWPLMYPTIAVEGSDSFDALSRSYSYLYQAPWHFIGYAVTALLYGAAVVFFVGLMGSLMVYLGQWGFSQAPGLASDNPESDRTPAYLFEHAPTSLGWRDLLLHDSVWAKPGDVQPVGVGSAPAHLKLDPKYDAAISIPNRIGGYLVMLWLGITFLLVLGFSYSYFWTASTILYFLLRKKVDDTDFDEIYLDDDDMPPPPPPMTPPSIMKEPLQPAVAKPGTVSLNVVEPPKTS